MQQRAKRGQSTINEQKKKQKVKPDYFLLMCICVKCSVELQIFFQPMG